MDMDLVRLGIAFLLFGVVPVILFIFLVTHDRRLEKQNERARREGSFYDRDRER